MTLFLHAPQYRPNLSSMVRSAEFFGFDRIYVFDAFDLLAPPTNKKQRADMNHLARVWTAGAVEHIEVVRVEEVNSIFEECRQQGGRLVGTVVDERAHSLDSFQFMQDDLIIFGNERDGLPKELLDVLDASIYISSRGYTDCLNVAVTFGIVVHAAVTATNSK